MAAAKSALLTGPEVAALVGVTPSTWRSYVAKGEAPVPDVVDTSVPVQRRRPKWRLSTVETFLANRPGQGRRTDLEGR